MNESLFILFQELLAISHDKVIHALVGIVVYAVFCYWFGMYAMIAVLLAAVFKELYDVYYLHTVWNYKDVLATLAGGLIGMIITALS